MNALEQYIQLYKEHTALVDSGSDPVMNSLRNSALAWLENNPLPKKGSENYETTDLQEILSPDFGVNLGRVNIDVNAMAPFHCGVPNLSSALFFLRNDIYGEASEARAQLPEGIYVNSLKNFCREYPELAKKYYGRIADIRNPLVALNTLLVQDGIVIWAKEGVKVEKPIQIVGILENGMPLAAFRRLLIIVEKNADIKILSCDHTQTDNVKLLNLVTTEIIAEEEASVEFCEMEESTLLTSRLSSVYTRQGKNSKVSAVTVTLYNGNTRNEFHCGFAGENATLHLAGMAIEDKDRRIDTYSVVEHTSPGCTTDELVKYVVDDNAVGTFSGLIRVHNGATKTEAYQNSRNIIGTDSARVYSKPTLEIYDDDVKCSHGSAIGQLDERQIFYMRTRGLTEEKARFLLKQAFMADVIDRITIPDFKLRLHSLVERRFAGGDRNCASCRSNCLPDEGDTQK